MSERNVGKVEYKKGVVPDDYKCDHCGAHGIRLWREYQSMAYITTLLCADCAEERGRKSHGGSWRSSFSQGQGNQIGWFIPAVPVERENNYCSYTSIPVDGYNWWNRLPTRL